MSVNVGQIDLGLDVDKKHFNKQLGGIAGGAQKNVKKMFGSLGTAIGVTLGAAAVFSFTKSSLELGSALSEVQNVVDTVFPSMNNQVNNFASNAMEQFGLSETVAKKYVGTLGAMSKAMGFSEAQSYEMAESVAGLAGDVASFYDSSSDVAYTKLKSIWTGETETLKDLGIIMTQANLDQYALNEGLGKTTKTMTEQEKAMLRYRYVMSGLSDAQGDFSKTSDSWANQMRVLTLRFESFKATVGQGLIPVFTPVIQTLNTFIEKLQIGAEYFKAFTNLIYGNSEETKNANKNTGALVSSTENVGSAVKEAGKAIKKSLSSFDELNILTQTTSEGMDDVAGGSSMMADFGLDDIDSESVTALDPITKSVEDFVDNVKKDISTFKKIFGPPIKKAIKATLPVFNRWRDFFTEVFEDFISFGEPIKEWFISDVVPLWNKGISVLGGVIFGFLDSLLMVFQSFKDFVMPIIEWFVINGLPILTSFVSGALTIFQSLFQGAKSIFDMIWSQAVDPAMKLIRDIIIDALNLVKKWWGKWGDNIIKSIVGFIESTVTLLKTFWDNMLLPLIEGGLKSLRWLWDEHIKGLVEVLLDFVGTLITGALDIYNGFIAPMIGWMVEKFGPRISNTLQFVMDVFGTLLATVIDIAAGILTSLGGIIDWIVGVFTGDWERAFQGVSDVFKGIFMGLEGIAKGAINLVIDAVNWMIRKINNLSIDIPEWMEDKFGMQDIGFNISEIPKLANGGLVSEPTLAMVGDNKNAATDPEIIAPLSKLQGLLEKNSGNQEMVVILKEILDALREGKVMSVDKKVLAEVVSKSLKSNNRMAGETVLNL